MVHTRAGEVQWYNGTMVLSLSLLLSVSAMLRLHSSLPGKTVLSKLSFLNQQCDLILASGSPRRKELLSLMGIQNFRILVSDFAEDLDKKLFATASDYCLQTSRKKVENVIASLGSSVAKNTIVIGADTIVVVDDIVLEKPADDNDAKRMLLMLNGNTHLVHTAVTIYSNALSGNAVEHYASFVETSQVTFAPLSENDIIAYIATGEGRDKAGSYGIQGLGGQMVQSIQGCYFNIMGLPVHSLSCKLADLIHDIEKKDTEL
jgi:septum formation protein